MQQERAQAAFVSPPRIASVPVHQSWLKTNFQHMDWVSSIPFFAVHLWAINAFFIPITWSLFGLAVGSYVLRMFAITAGYHRYFSHRTFKTSRVFQFVLAWIGSASVQKGVLWWAANHRHHHRYSDQKEDIHSPKQKGFWWSHMFWILSDKYDETHFDRIPDLAKYPELMWLNKYWIVSVVSYAAIFLAFWGYPGLVYGFVLSTVFLWHGTFTINSLTHVFGSRRFETSDTSRNNLFFALITLGEGWHNNHHKYASSVRQGFAWYEIDISYMVLRFLSWFGIVWDIKEPPSIESLKKITLSKIT